MPSLASGADGRVLERAPAFGTPLAPARVVPRSHWSLILALRATVVFFLTHAAAVGYFFRPGTVSERAWMVGSVAVAALLFAGYLSAAEWRLVRNYQYLPPFVMLDLVLAVVFFGVGVNDLLARLARGDMVVPAGAEGLWVVVGVSIAVVVGVLFGRMLTTVRTLVRDAVVAVRFGPTTADKRKAIKLAWSLGIALVVHILDPTSIPLPVKSACLLIGAAIGLCYEVVVHGARAWVARVRARAFLVVFPKVKPSAQVGTGELRWKFEIESCLFAGDLRKAAEMIEAAALSPREKYVLAMTVEFLRGNYVEIIRLATVEEYAARVEPPSERVQAMLLNAYFALGRYRELDEMLMTLSGARNAYIQVNAALICRERGRRDAAYKHAQLAHELDPGCPLVVAVYTRLSYENSDVQTRDNRLDEWLKQLGGARDNFNNYYQPYLERLDAKRWKDGQAWKVALFLVTSEAHFLVRKGDAKSLQSALQLLRAGFEIAPQDPWLRFETALYLRRIRGEIARGRFWSIRVAIWEFKWIWQLRSIERASGARAIDVGSLEASGISIRWYLTHDATMTRTEP